MRRREEDFTREDLARERSKKQFIGRTQEVAQFQQNLNLPLMIRKLIWVVTGEGGFGKSELLQQFKTVAEQANFITIWLDKQVPPTVLSVLGEISRQLKQKDIELKSFSKEYTRVMERLFSREGQKADRVSRSAGNVIDSGLEELPGFGFFNALAEEIGGMTVGEGLSQYGAELYRSFHAGMNEPDFIVERTRELSRIFVSELSEVAEQQPIVLFVDDYERLHSFFDQWLRDVLESKYGDFSVKIMVVIAGRMALSGGWLSKQLRPFLKTIELTPFSMDEALDFLEQRDIRRDENIAQIILESTRRIPLLMALLTSHVPETAEKLVDPTDRAIDVFLKWVPAEKRRLFLICAVPRTLNLDKVEVLVDEPVADESFQLIKQESFVEKNITSDGWLYHDEIRYLMLRHLHNVGEKRWNLLNQLMANHHIERRNQLGLEIKLGFQNPDWQVHDLESLYHTVCAQKRAAIDMVVKRLLDGNEWASPSDYDIRLGNIIAEAGRVLEDEAIVELGDMISDGIEGYYINGNHEAILPLLDFLVENSQRISLQRYIHAVNWRGRVKARTGDKAGAMQDFNRSAELQPWSVHAHYLHGRGLYDLDRYAGAEADFTEVIGRQPEEGDYYYWRGRARFGKEEYEAAIGDFTEAIKLQPEDRANHYWRGYSRYMKRDYVGAIDDYNKALNIEPSDAQTYHHRAHAYEGMKRYKDALSDFDQTVSLTPDQPVNYRCRGKLHEKLGDSDSALADLTEAIRLDPTDAWSLHSRGHIYQDRDEYEAALEDFRRASELEPRIGAHYRCRGNLQGKKLEDTVAALADLTEAIRLDPTDARAYHDRGHIYEDRGEYEAALEDFRRASELEPKKGLHYRCRGKLYKKLEDTAAAFADLTEAIRLDPTDASSHHDRAHIYQDRGEYKAALEDFRRASELEPNNSTHYLCRGILHQNLQDDIPSVANFSKAIELQPENDTYYFLRGRFQFEREEYEAAIGDFTEAIELQPESDTYYYWRGRARLGKEEYESAIGDFTKVIDFRPEEDAYYYWRGRARLGKEEYEAAIGDFTEAIELQPESDVYYYFRGVSQFAREEYEATIGDFTEAIELQPESDVYYYSRGASQFAREEYEATIEDFTEAIELQPESDTYYFLRGRSQFALEEYKAATEDFTKAIELQSGEGDYYYWRGRARLGKEEYESAIGDFTEAIELQPEDPACYVWRGRGFLMLGLADRARADFTFVEALPVRNGRPAYVISQGYALNSETQQALRFLKIACDKDAALADEALSDDSFEQLRSSDEFQALVRDYIDPKEQDLVS